MGSYKGRGLLFDKVLLEYYEDLLRVHKCQAEGLDALAGFLQDDYSGEGFFASIVFVHNKLDFELHGSSPPVCVTPNGGSFYWQAWCPPGWPSRTAMGVWRGHLAGARIEQEMLLALKRQGGALWLGTEPLDNRGRPRISEYAADANTTELLWQWVQRCPRLGHVRFQFPYGRVLCIIAWGDAYEVQGSGTTRAEALCRAALALAPALRQQAREAGLGNDHQDEDDLITS
jgi:hypothetical protein